MPKTEVILICRQYPAHSQIEEVPLRGLAGDQAEESYPAVLLKMRTSESWLLDEEQRHISARGVREQIEERLRLWLIEG